MSTDQSSSDDGNRSLVQTRTVDRVVSVILLLIGVVLAIENWRVGAMWAAEGPQSGYFPFRLSIILIAASAWGLLLSIRAGGTADKPFVHREAFIRVLQILIPTILFVAAIKVIGLYAASALLILAFMVWLGGSGWVLSLVTSVVFSLAIFWMFEVQFKVLLPKGPIEAWLGF